MPVLEAVARLRPKNQITLPAAIAKHLGAEPGDRLIFEIDDGELGRVRVRRLLRSYAGILEGVYGNTPEEIAAYLREERASWGE